MKKVISIFGLLYVISITVSVLVVLPFEPNTVLADTPGANAPAPAAGRIDYIPLAPIPQTVKSGCDFNDPKAICHTDFYTYLDGFFKIAISLAGVLAVLQIIYGGFEYVFSATPMGKSGGKERITNAFIGLALTLSSWLILYTINPSLIILKIAPTKITDKPIAPEPLAAANNPAQYAADAKQSEKNADEIFSDQQKQLNLVGTALKTNSSEEDSISLLESQRVIQKRLDAMKLINANYDYTLKVANEEKDPKVRAATMYQLASSALARDGKNQATLLQQSGDTAGAQTILEYTDAKQRALKLESYSIDTPKAVDVNDFTNPNNPYIPKASEY